MNKDLWASIRDEINEQILNEPDLGNYLSKRILQHGDLESAISELLSGKLASEDMPQPVLKGVFDEALRTDVSIIELITTDLLAIRERDPAVKNYSTAILHFKGFQALQSYRIAHWLWHKERCGMALYIQSQCSEVFGVDIHPAARIGKGILLDHATGIVIGETCVLDDNISILQGVTLGGTGKDSGDRHPKIQTGVLIGAGANVLGNVVIGEGAWIGAGSVVLNDVEAHSTVVGIPAKVVGRPRTEQPALDMDHHQNDKD
ncbi:MAG: serine O-acetyltransferase [Gammaproteobacteria bacterium]|nr:serine O-acetyltransferase [Gammaproteobacteria bacterium]